jgi:hypothetical protein
MKVYALSVHSNNINAFEHDYLCNKIIHILSIARGAPPLIFIFSMITAPSFLHYTKPAAVSPCPARRSSSSNCVLRNGCCSGMAAVVDKLVYPSIIKLITKFYKNYAAFIFNVV